LSEKNKLADRKIFKDHIVLGKEARMIDRFKMLNRA